MSANIKKYRKKRAISQEQLAELMGVSPQTINCVEGCRAWVSDKTLGKLAAALGVEAFQLLGPPENEKQDKAAQDLALELQLQRLQRELKDAIDDRFLSFVQVRNENARAEKPADRSGVSK
ncbi:MAG: helix-turn-helix transcriptional regulator [Treponema sp.]|nr:helix-turn-helix transcriptional regulator [Treponema sp.]